MTSRSHSHSPTNGSPDHLAASIQPRPFSDPLFEQSQSEPLQSAGYDFSHTDLFSHAPQRNPIQMKLAIGEPNDHYEQEADRVAEQVLSTPDSAVPQSIQREEMPAAAEEPQTKLLVETVTPLVQREAVAQEGLQMKLLSYAAIQRHALSGEDEAPRKTRQSLTPNAVPSTEELPNVPYSSPSLENRLNSSNGAPLSPELLGFMEPRFGVDFSKVRVHTDSNAIQMSQELNAQAFTHNQNIYFAPGKFNPASISGKHLLAHELTHVVQQNSNTIQRKPGQSGVAVTGRLEGDRLSLKPKKMHLDFVRMKRKDPTYVKEILSRIQEKFGHEFVDTDDATFGHWWTEVGDLEGENWKPLESFGWWPQGGVGSLKSLFQGVPGILNEGKQKDPYHGDDAEEVFHPVMEVDDEVKDYTTVRSEVVGGIKSFAQGFQGSWNWKLGWGKNCQTFQKRMKTQLGLHNQTSKYWLYRPKEANTLTELQMRLTGIKLSNGIDITQEMMDSLLLSDMDFSECFTQTRHINTLKETDYQLIARVLQVPLTEVRAGITIIRNLLTEREDQLRRVVGEEYILQSPINAKRGTSIIPIPIGTQIYIRSISGNQVCLEISRDFSGTYIAPLSEVMTGIGLSTVGVQPDSARKPESSSPYDAGLDDQEFSIEASPLAERVPAQLGNDPSASSPNNPGDSAPHSGVPQTEEVEGNYNVLESESSSTQPDAVSQTEEVEDSYNALESESSSTQPDAVSQTGEVETGEVETDNYNSTEEPASQGAATQLPSSLTHQGTGSSNSGLPKKSKLPEDRADRYKQRAETLKAAQNLIAAGVQYTRAYALYPEISYAYDAAWSFEAGEDLERATFWYRKAIQTDPGSAIAAAARKHLTTLGQAETARYKTSDLIPGTRSKYLSVRKGDQPFSVSPTTRQQQKATGLTKEQMQSSDAFTLFTSYANGIITAENTLIAANTDEERNQARQEIEKRITAIRNMATGFDPNALLNEYKQKQTNPSGATPLLDQLQGFTVAYLDTTAKRDDKKLVYEGKIKQGMPPRSLEADETGYDTTQLSSNFAGAGYAIFAMDGDGKIYADQHKVSQFHHTSFLAASEAAAAGELKVESGVLKTITNKSGHYAQGATFITQALDEFQSTFHQDLSSVDLRFHNAASKEPVAWKTKASGFVQDVQQMLASNQYDDTFGSHLNPTQIQGEVERLKGQSSPISGKPVSQPQSPIGSQNVLPGNVETNSPYGVKIPVNQPADGSNSPYGVKIPEGNAVTGAQSMKSANVSVPQVPVAGAIANSTNFIQGNQGALISSQLLTAIREDILTPRSKWADNQEILAVAEALGVQITIHANRGTFGSSGQMYHLYYNGRDHYSVYVRDRNGSIRLGNQSYSLVNVTGDGDCFYYAIAKAISPVIFQSRLGVNNLRSLANQHLSDAQIADIAIPLAQDYGRNPDMPGLGHKFRALMQTGETHFISS